jgi:hypothetical protein
MTSDEQINFVKTLAEEIVECVLDDILNDKIPTDWDGIELRQLLADRFTRSVFKGTLTGARLRDYKNIVLINDL